MHKCVIDCLELIKDWNYEINDNNGIKPEETTIYSHKKVSWICKKGHKWTATVASRSNGNGCPFCSGREVILNNNDLLSCCPKIAKEWNYEKKW